MLIPSKHIRYLNSASGGGTIQEAPIDNFSYTRKNGVWSRISIETNSTMDDYVFTATEALTYTIPFSIPRKENLYISINALTLYPDNFSISNNQITFESGVVEVGDIIFVKLINPLLSITQLDDTPNDDIVYIRKNKQWINLLTNSVDTATSLGTSDTKMPSQNAVKTYIDTKATTDIDNFKKYAKKMALIFG